MVVGLVAGSADLATLILPFFPAFFATVAHDLRSVAGGGIWVGWWIGSAMGAGAFLWVMGNDMGVGVSGRRVVLHIAVMSSVSLSMSSTSSSIADL